MCAKQKLIFTSLLLNSKHMEMTVTVELHGVFVTGIVRGCCQYRNEFSSRIKREMFLIMSATIITITSNRILLCELDWFFDQRDSGISL
jgi:hypothetical protein